MGGLILGLLSVALLIRAVGAEGFGVVSLLGPTVGLSALLQDVVRETMIRELGVAYHSDDSQLLPRVYNACIRVCAGTAAVTLGLIICVVAMLPFFRIPAELLPAARYFFAAAGAQAVVAVLLAPAFNMYRVSERMVLANFWILLERAADVLAAIVVYFVVAPVAQLVIIYGCVSYGIKLVIQLVACGSIIVADRRLVPRLGVATSEDYRQVVTGCGWNAAVEIAANLHLRVDAIIMNLCFGVFYNGIFGIAVRASSYVRMLAIGSTNGIDAVAARLTSRAKSVKLPLLTQYSTKLHAVVTFPAIVCVFLLAEPFVSLWVGDSLRDPQAVTRTVVLVRILLVGVAIRSIADGWQKLLYGAGFVRSYAIPVLIGGIANPVIALILLGLWPDRVGYTAVAWAYSISFTGVQLILFPIIVMRCIGCGFDQVISPIIRPMIISIVLSPVLMLFIRKVEVWTISWLALAACAYGGVYLCAMCLVGFTAAERISVLAGLSAIWSKRSVSDAN